MIRVMSVLFSFLLLIACDQDQSFFLINLTQEAKNGMLNKPFIGAKKQVETLAKVVAGINQYSSIIILGEVGSGKTAIVEEVARLCAGLNIDKYSELRDLNLADQVIVYFDIAKLAKSYGCSRITIKQFKNEMEKIKSKFGKKMIILIGQLGRIIWNNEINSDDCLFIKNLLHYNRVILMVDPYDIDIVDEALASSVEVVTPVDWEKDDLQKIFNVWKAYLAQKKLISFSEGIFLESEKNTGSSYAIVSLLKGAINEAKKTNLERDSIGRIVVKREHVEKYYSSMVFDIMIEDG